MKTWKIFTVLLLFVGFASCQPSADNLQSARPFLDEYEAALQSNSAEAIAALFHTDASILADGKPAIKGNAEIKKHYQKLKTLDFEEKITIEESFRAGEYLIVQTTSTGKWRKKETEEFQEFRVKGQMILQPSAGKSWKIFKYTHFNNTAMEKTYPQKIDSKFAHVVFFWLKDDSDVTKMAFQASLEKFINSSEYVKYMHIGTSAGTKRTVVDNSFSYCLIATFNSKEEQDKYQKEQVHLDFIEEAQQYWERVQVYDSITE